MGPSRPSSAASAATRTSYGQAGVEDIDRLTGVLGESTTGSDLDQAARAAPAEMPAWYRIYGVLVRSDLSLPVPPVSSPVDAAPAWTFRRAGLSGPASEPAAVTMLRERGTVAAGVSHADDGALVWFRSVGAFRVSADSTRVDVCPEEGADERALGLALTGPVATYLLQRLARPVLHASAVVTARGAVGFLGRRGQGKTTMAACFLRRGSALLADDALPLRLVRGKVLGGPGLPLMKIWREAADHALELADHLPDLMDNYPKKLLDLAGRFAFAETPARLRLLYFLDRYDPAVAGRTDVSARVLSEREAFTALVAQTSWRSLLLPAEMARLLPTYARLVAQTRVAVLSYPGGFEHQEAVYQRIMAELAGR